MPGRLLLIPLCEIFGLLGFMYFAARLGSQEIRYLPLVLAAILVIWLAVKGGKELTPRQIALVSISVSVVFVILFQMLGFVFSGLAKDIDLFSLSNLVRLGTIGMLAVAGHAGLFTAVRYFRR